MKRIIITDDNPRDRSFLAELTQHYDPIVTANADEAISVCRAHPSTTPFVITDIQMPGCSGIELAKRIWKNRPDARIVFWSQYSDETYVRVLVNLVPPETVYGYVLKNNTAETLLRALDTVFEDCQCWIDPHVRHVQARSTRNSEALTDAEYEVLVDIALGLTDNCIAERHFLSRRGVQNRLQSLYAKLGANMEHNDNTQEYGMLNVRTRAVSLALQRGLINAYELNKEQQRLAHWVNTKRS